jgi:hypothetical protein
VCGVRIRIFAASFQPLKLVVICRRWPSCARRVEGAGDLGLQSGRILDDRLPLGRMCGCVGLTARPRFTSSAR